MPEITPVFTQGTTVLIALVAAWEWVWMADAATAALVRNTFTENLVSNMCYTASIVSLLYTTTVLAHRIITFEDVRSLDYVVYAIAVIGALPSLLVTHQVASSPLFLAKSRYLDFLPLVSLALLLTLKWMWQIHVRGRIPFDLVDVEGKIVICTGGFRRELID